MSTDIDFDAMTDEEYAAFERTTLMAPDDMAELIQDAREFIRGNIVHNDVVIPRYGMLTLKARRTPMYCYGHPDIKKRFPKSFNDGQNIFVSDDYLKELMVAEDQSEGLREGIVPLVLHHLLHMIMNHKTRFKKYHPTIVSMGADISVYCKMKLAFPQMEWVLPLEREFLASTFTDAQIKEYAKKAEDTIIRELTVRYWNELPKDTPTTEEVDASLDTPKKPKDPTIKKDKKKDKDAKGEKSDGESDEAGDGEPDPNAEAESGKPQKIDKDALKKALKQMGISDAEVNPDDVDDHEIDMEEMAQMVEDLGLSTTKERLEIPEPWDYESMERKTEKTRVEDLADIQQSIRIAGEAGTAGGGSLAGDAHEEAMKATEGKLTWRLAVQQMVGASMEYDYSEEEPGALYFIDPADMGLKNEIYVGTDLPMKSENVVMVLMDSSGSITQDLMKAFLSEVFSLVRSEQSQSLASEVVLLFCDDVIRGKPIFITPDNAEELMSRPMNVYGRGGNDIGGTIRQAAKLKEFEEKKIQAMIYFTDLGDAPPVKSDVPEGMPLIFVCPPDYYQEEFTRAVKGFAKVYPIEEDLEVDLSKESFLEADVKIKTKIKKGFGF